jgi:hypothetical protein
VCNGEHAIDPNLFHLDWERLFEVLAAIVVLAFVLERGLALIFEHRLYMDHVQGKGLKEFIAFAAALLVCWAWKFDTLSMILLREQTTLLGEAITAGVIAGGSKRAVTLFCDLLDIKSSHFKQAEAASASRGRPGKQPAAGSA